MYDINEVILQRNRISAFHTNINGSDDGLYVDGTKPLPAPA